MVQRVAVTQSQVFLYGLDMRSGTIQSAIQNDGWMRVRQGLAESGWSTQVHGIRIAGERRRWLLREDITKTEKRRGFRVVEDVGDDADELL